MSIFVQLLNNFDRKFGRVFEYYNVIHRMVQAEFVAMGKGRIAAEHACMARGSRLRPDLCTTWAEGKSGPIGLAEVKYNHPASLFIGAVQLAGYVTTFSGLNTGTAYYRACSPNAATADPQQAHVWTSQGDRGAIPIGIGSLAGRIEWQFYCKPVHPNYSDWHGLVSYWVTPGLIPRSLPAWEEVKAKFYETLANMSSVLAALNAGLTHPAPGVAPAVFWTALEGVYQDLGLYASMVRSVPTHWNWAYGMVAVLGLGAVYRFMYVPVFIGWPRL